MFTHSKIEGGPMSNARNAWIKAALAKRGYKQRDLARNWSVAEGSVTRFISGEENQNLAMTKAITLSRMLGISLDDLAQGLGLDGKAVEPEIPAQAEASLAPGTFKTEIIGGGRVRVTFCQDLAPEVAAQIMTAIASAKA
jgi:transcriptional regulator with XRE-family HTH domain